MVASVACSGGKGGAEPAASSGAGGDGGAGAKPGAGSSGSPSSGGKSGAAGGSAGSASGGSGAAAECAELAACCSSVTDSTLQGVCSSGAQVDCGLTLSILIANGQCQPDPGAGLPPVTLDGSWSEPSQVDNLLWQGQTVSISSPIIHACGEGDALAAWFFQSGEVGQVQVARYLSASGSWQVMKQVDQNSGYRPGEPLLAVTPSCEALVVWEERLPVLGSSSDEYTLVGASYDGSVFSSPVTLQPLSTARIEAPYIAVSPEGDGVVIFKRGQQLFHQPYGVGSGVQAAEAVGEASLGPGYVASLSDGTTLQVHTTYDSVTSTSAVLFQLLTSAWSEPKPLLDTSGGAPQRLVTVAAGDRFYVFYPTEGALRFVSVTSAGVVSEPSMVAQASAEASVAAYGEHVLVAWKDGKQIRAARRVAGGDWAEPTTISFEAHEVLDFDVAVAPDGAAMLAYQSVDYDVFANRLAASGEWLGPHAVASSGTGPRLEATEGGAFWLSYNGSYGGLAMPQRAAWIQRFTPNAAP
ncbi:MAG: hypothetical protein EOO73_33420 [Myxococcales bacterium]|nr:MAG: hypothetical protein EOO73_33420 [Myxococcales bacterium]